jgi:GT2 family glycosyltransferase/glycosyltransferase involved in cell wall biosynthesis
MNADRLIAAASFSPNLFRSPSAWLGHLPFAGWIIREIKPKIFVELGTHHGHSYFSFCQSVMEADISTKCYAVDTWQGDFQTGLYNNEIFENVHTHNQKLYANFSHLLKMQFDDATSHFLDGSIDLLHIDGLHTYEAIKHDFETWLPKLAPGAVVLFHDTQVRERGFGVWKFWEELQARYSHHLEFSHSFGLGVLQLDGAPRTKSFDWLEPTSKEQEILRNYFSALGERQKERFELDTANTNAAHLNATVLERDAQILTLSRTIEERDEQLLTLSRTIGERDEQINAIYSSNSWYITKPLRFISRNFKRAIYLSSKVSAAKMRYLFQLTVPHLHAVRDNPASLRTKFYFLRAAWAAGGPKEVIRRLQASGEHRGLLPPQHKDSSFQRLTERLANWTTQHKSITIKLQPKLSVILPVYRGLAETTRCIESLLHSKNLTPYDIIVINDASPEEEITSYLDSLKENNARLKIFTNVENLGFVKTVNVGMQLAVDADVILLNSDTVVSNNWIDRLVAQAYADSKVGTVTPFSNNATICSYPDLEGWDNLPKGENVSQVDSAFSLANACQAIEIPTAVGFCMYIKRACLENVGLFDEDAFGKGYGEENDFCLRATNKGWRHLLAADVFVFHEGEVSFGNDASLKKSRAMDIMRTRYPSYEHTITQHINNNAAHEYRVAATAARYRLGSQPVILFVTHNLGGGTEKHVQDIASTASKNGVRILFLRPSKLGNSHCVTLQAYNKIDRLDINLEAHNVLLLARALSAFGITKIHIHHVIGFSFPLEELTAAIQAPYDITIHDFYSICPRVNMFVPQSGYCGTPNIEECNTCLSKDQKFNQETDILWWRAKSSSLLNGAENVYCPSKDTASRITNYFPSAPVKVVPHEEISLPLPRYANTARNIRRICILGTLAEHKGLSVVESLLKVVQEKNLLLEFTLIGHSERPLKKSQYFSHTGPYNDKDLATLIEQFDPDAIFFPAQCPETYSYTLSEAIRSGRPILVANIGALPERVENLPNGYIFPHNLSVLELANYLESVPLRSASSDLEFDVRMA